MKQKPEFRIGQHVLVLGNSDFDPEKDFDIWEGEIKHLCYDDDLGGFLYDVEVEGVMYTRRDIDCFTNMADAEEHIEDTLQTFIDEDTDNVDEAQAELDAAKDALARDQGMLDKWHARNKK